METDIVNVLVNVGGYGALCWLLLQQMGKERDAHREEVASLSEVVRENTKAVAALTTLIQSGGLVGVGGHGSGSADLSREF